MNANKKLVTLDYKVERHRFLNSPVRDESYKGFFKENGFHKKDEEALCDVEAINSSIIKLTLWRIYNTDDFPYYLGLGMQHQEAIFYELNGLGLNIGTSTFRYDCKKIIKCAELPMSDNLCKEKKVMRKIQSGLKRFEDAGGKAWHGYLISVPFTTLRFGKVAVIKDDYNGAEEKSKQLLEYSLKTANDIYQKLKVNDFKNLLDVIKRLQNGTLKMRTENVYKIPEFQKGLHAAGLNDCDKEMRAKLKDYCSKEGIQLESFVCTYDDED